jgi:hypothetical protein
MMGITALRTGRTKAASLLLQGRVPERQAPKATSSATTTDAREGSTNG